MFYSRVLVVISFFFLVGVGSDTSQRLGNALEICQALLELDITSFMQRITNSLRYFHHRDEDVFAYQRFFYVLLAAAGLKVGPAFADGCNSIVLETDKAYFIFEFATTTADEALARIEKRKRTLYFHRSRDVFCVGVNFRYAAPRQFVCNWIADWYSESGLLRQSLPGEETTPYSLLQLQQQVHIKREPVRDTYTVIDDDELGSGSFATVRKCIEKTTGNTFAAKFISVSRNDDERRDYVREEIDVMNRLQHHPKLKSLHDAFENEDEIVLIVEFLYGENLYSRKSSFTRIETEAEVISYIRQICEAIKHMHDRNIIHLDIRPENVVCQTQLSKDVKLIDFGLARKLYDRTALKRNVSFGASDYVAPEVLEDKQLGFHTDMWSVGVVSYFLLGGLYPFADESDFKTRERVKACRWRFDDDYFQSISHEGKDFIRNLLVKNEKKRMTVDECLNHPWLTRDHSKTDHGNKLVKILTIPN